MEIPDSMQKELGRWNNNDGIDLESWIGLSGSFELAIGYCTIFWPTLIQLDGYIVHEDTSTESINGFAQREGATRASVERVLNHIHLADIHFNQKVTKDKLLVLGNVLKEIYTAKLKTQFPHNPCEVEFYIPEDEEDLSEYQLSFWQSEGEKTPAHSILTP